MPKRPKLKGTPGQKAACAFGEESRAVVSHYGGNSQRPDVSGGRQGQAWAPSQAGSSETGTGIAALDFAPVSSSLGVCDAPVIPTTTRGRHSHGNQRRPCRRSGNCCDNRTGFGFCCSCGHRVAVALVPFVIRWGADASSDMMRTRVRYSVCSRRGATLQHPSWDDSEMGWQVFPVA